MAKTTTSTIEDEPIVERMVIPITQSLADEIRDFRFDERIETKSEAVRQLIIAGLKAKKRR